MHISKSNRHKWQLSASISSTPSLKEQNTKQPCKQQLTCAKNNSLPAFYLLQTLQLFTLMLSLDHHSVKPGQTWKGHSIGRSPRSPGVEPVICVDEKASQFLQSDGCANDSIAGHGSGWSWVGQRVCGHWGGWDSLSLVAAVVCAGVVWERDYCVDEVPCVVGREYSLGGSFCFVAAPGFGNLQQSTSRNYFNNKHTCWQWCFWQCSR